MFRLPAVRGGAAGPHILQVTENRQGPSRHTFAPLPPRRDGGLHSRERGVTAKTLAQRKN
jgi:hypothetical protein